MTRWVSDETFATRQDDFTAQLLHLESRTTRSCMRPRPDLHDSWHGEREELGNLCHDFTRRTEQAMQAIEKQILPVNRSPPKVVNNP